jgi:hypothetical protein
MLSEILAGQEKFLDGVRGGISPTRVPESLILPMKMWLLSLKDE